MRTLELRIPPVALVMAFGVGIWLLARLAPSPLLAIPGAGWFALALVASGIGLSLAGVVAFRRARTTVNPTTPDSSSTIVASGVYRWSRNPMYMGFLLVLLGWAVYLSSAAALLLLPAFVLYMNRYQIQPEERALEARFGKEYVEYRQRVRRWL